MHQHFSPKFLFTQDQGISTGIALTVIRFGQTPVLFSLAVDRIRGLRQERRRRRQAVVSVFAVAAALWMAEARWFLCFYRPARRLRSRY